MSKVWRVWCGESHFLSVFAKNLPYWPVSQNQVGKSWFWPVFDSQIDGKCLVPDSASGAHRAAAPDLPSFTAGTMILTDRGERAVETLRAGDRVLTRDNGFRQLIWTGACARDWGASKRVLSLLPIQILAGALGEGHPAKDIVVAPDQRLLIAGAFGRGLGQVKEVLARAADLVGLHGVRRMRAGVPHYVQIALGRHDLICANGCWSESLPLTHAVLRSLPMSAHRSLGAMLSEEGGASAAARPDIDLGLLRACAVA
ncbi:Hint domain-containing protein [Defluviimonas sp. WL0002]|uniref:Hint domain-containing protein n=1 Tax=Albidovulum marisflavi TaxID=2984159 RepID=A0ABT2ZG91_9RHOB|nr:Hint domain-containing protein [Defluviimonas sp. WL0002]MCV2870048.1 Hint domain-containing protein [Defluviimonas sp. WL0002]